MQIGREPLKTALRVLAAIGEHHEPDPADVRELKALDPAFAGIEGVTLGELACDVIQHVLAQRAEMRA